MYKFLIFLFVTGNTCLGQDSIQLELPKELGELLNSKSKISDMKTVLGEEFKESQQTGRIYRTEFGCVREYFIIFNYKKKGVKIYYKGNSLKKAEKKWLSYIEVTNSDYVKFNGLITVDKTKGSEIEKNFSAKKNSINEDVNLYSLQQNKFVFTFYSNRKTDVLELIRIRKL